MAYKTGEARILTLIQAIVADSSWDAWDATNSLSLANDTTQMGMKLANRGKSYHYLFLQPGPFERLRPAIHARVVRTTYTTHISLLVLANTNRGWEKTLVEDRERIVGQLDKYSRLNALSGVLDAFVDMAYPMEHRTFQTHRGKQQLIFVQQILRMIWQEEEIVSTVD